MYRCPISGTQGSNGTQCTGFPVPGDHRDPSYTGYTRDTSDPSAQVSHPRIFTDARFHKIPVVLWTTMIPASYLYVISDPRDYKITIVPGSSRDLSDEGPHYIGVPS